MTKWHISWECKAGSTFLKISIIPCINRLTKIKCAFTSIDRTFAKIHHHLWLKKKKLSKLERAPPQPDKGIYKKSIANFIFNCNRLSVLPLGLRTMQRYLLSYSYSAKYWKIVVVRYCGPTYCGSKLWEKIINRIKSIQFWKEGIKLSLFTDDMIVYIENLK